MHLAVRVDGGADIGLGHLIRASALADIVLDRGSDVTVFTTTPKSARDVFPTSINVVPLSERGSADEFVEKMHDSSYDAVFTDAYPVDTTYQRAVRRRYPLIVHQDDARHAVDADALVNGNLYAQDLTYEFVGRGPRRCLGTDYTLLRRNIAAFAAREPPWRQEPERAIVVMGGSDVAGETPAVVRAFDGPQIEVDAIVGPGVSEAAEQRVRRAGSEVSVDVRVLRDPPDLPERIFRADLGVCTASSTVYEFLALGTPIVCKAVVENQMRLAQTIRERDVGTALESDAGEPEYSKAVREYVASPSFRKRRRDLGRELVDYRGSERTADVVRQIVDE